MCIFCKLANKEIPSSIVYENEYVLAFLDLSQATMGHTLVIPKKHFDNIYELDELYASEVFKAVVKVANAVKKAFNPIGANILNNNEKPLQSVGHFHVHIIPRYENDGLIIEGKDNSNKYNLSELKDKISQFI